MRKILRVILVEIIRTKIGLVRKAIEDLLEQVLAKVGSGWLLWIDKDNDLDSLRELPRFTQMMAKARERFAVPITHVEALRKVQGHYPVASHSVTARG